MAADRIQFSVIHTGREIAMGPTDPIDSIGVSLLKPYLAASFGQDVPYNPQLRYATDQVCETAAAYSTDEWLAQPAIEKLPKLVPRVLHLLTPVVDATKRLGSLVDGQLAAHEADTVKRGHESMQDLTYSFGMFDLLVFLNAAELDLAHPRFPAGSTARSRFEAALPKGRIVNAGGDPDNPQLLSALLRTPLVKLEHRRKFELLRKQTRAMITQAEADVDRMRQVLADYY